MRSCGVDQPLRVVLIGTDFELRVWETLLEFPDGPHYHLFRYRRARLDAEGGARGRRSGRQEPGLVRGPCHRVLGKSGEITGYHWGLTRKRAMLGWEAGKTALEPVCIQDLRKCDSNSDSSVPIPKFARTRGKLSWNLECKGTLATLFFGPFSTSSQPSLQHECGTWVRGTVQLLPSALHAHRLQVDRRHARARKSPLR